ncbi:MAG TPA: 50S ribosomal protein L24 [Clostridia bacterium]
MAKVHVKKNDSVFILSGKDAGKTGKILDVFPDDNRVVVEGVNFISRHTKPKGRYQQGGIIRREAPVHGSNVMLVCPKCDRPTRVGRAIQENGDKVRVCKKCSAVIDIVTKAKTPAGK